MRADWVFGYCLTIIRHVGKIDPHCKLPYKWAEIAQLVEHATENCGVVSSILTLGTPDFMLVRPAGVVQLVERLLAKEKVMGSNPTARSRLWIAGC
jgi:hypothetical protein